MGHLLYKVLIAPLDLYFEAVYSIARDIFGISWLVVIPMSLAVSFICLPFYRRAEAIQAEERAREKEMEKWIRHIKRTFSGDERFFMLQAYYKLQGYHPIYALKSVLPLAMQIPFFISAYRFLSGLKSFQGIPFGPVADLSAPDGMLTFDGITVNVLPVLMTLINVLSSAIYAKDSTPREKIQLYGVALVFLILLYQSPSILVLYWICNNLFSLVRNIIDRAKNKSFLTCIAFAGLSAFFFLCAIFASVLNGEHHIIVYLVSGILLAAAIKAAGGEMIPDFVYWFPYKKLSNKVFFSGCLFLTVLIGFLIPSAVISSSPGEFVVLTAYQSPLIYLYDSTAVATGLFIIWFGFFFYLSNENDRKWFNLLILILAGTAIVNYLFFGTNLGPLSAFLQFDTAPVFSWKTILANAAVLVVIIVALVYLWCCWERNVRMAVSIALLAIIGMTGYNVVMISKAMPGIRAATTESSEKLPAYMLSKRGKNVVVLLLDKAVSGFIPYIIQEKPELKQQFEGFTWYPNTITYGWSTNIGSPAVYGGYEYTPEEMNRRSDEWLADKHNEALKLMPVLFEEAGFDVTVSDPPYAGYSEIPDLSIYDDYPDIKTCLTENGQFRFLLEDFEATDDTKPIIWHRNFFYYSLMKVMPLGIQPSVYQDGRYLNPTQLYTDLIHVQHTSSVSTAVGVKDKAINAFAALKALPDITEVSEKENGSFLLLYNCTAHDPMLYQTPEYTPSLSVDNTDYDSLHANRFLVDGCRININTIDQMVYYHANMAALLQLGIWFDWMRDNEVYDNTRIIIVADHGAKIEGFPDLILDAKRDIMYYIPLLMVKDFNASGFCTDNQFMTNADTPTLALQGLLEDPVNPFTGKVITNAPKLEGEQHILTSGSFKISENNGKTFLPGDWFAVKDDALNRENWTFLGKY